MKDVARSGHRDGSHEMSSPDLGIWAMILAGSAGPRLWPNQEQGRPAFLQSGRDGPSLLQRTLDSLAQEVPYEHMMLACAPTHIVPIAREHPAIPEGNIVVEPLPRGSGPVGAFIAALIAQEEPNSVVVSIPADHALLGLKDFPQSVRLGIAAARLGWTACFGLPLDQAESGYGYIERSSRRALVTVEGPIYQVDRFWHADEVDDVAKSRHPRRMLQNSGVFVSRVDTLLKDLGRLRPDLLHLSSRLLEGWDKYDYERLSYFLWSTQPISSIERDILERAERVAVVPPD